MLQLVLRRRRLLVVVMMAAVGLAAAAGIAIVMARGAQQAAPGPGRGGRGGAASAKAAAAAGQRTGLRLGKADPNDSAWTPPPHPVDSPSLNEPGGDEQAAGGRSLDRLACRINANVVKNVGGAAARAVKTDTLQCYIDQQANEAYVPFSFVKKYFDILGGVSSDGKGSPELEWSHSYSKVYPSLAAKRYSFKGQYLQFAQFEVVQRSKVKCITASKGVPLSIQWDKSGYYYATQIAQYGLSHWSKLKGINLRERSSTVYEDGNGHRVDWKGDVTFVTSEKCVHFDHSSAISFNPYNSREYVLFLTLLFRENVTLSVTLRTPALSYVLKYVASDEVLSRDGNVISYGYGSEKKHTEGQKIHFVRDLRSDLRKGMSKKAFASFTRQSPLRISEIKLEGVGCVSNISLHSEGHLAMFKQAADWLLENQDPSLGGWPNNVTFNKDRWKHPLAKEIPPGWYSAMAQGHALSVLSRAYDALGDVRYLESAMLALKPFTRASSEPGGFVAHFPHYSPPSASLTWYEEYPTSPPTFTLNGFMYGLFGLYDFMELLQNIQNLRGVGEDRIQDARDEVYSLFHQGMESLHKLLPLFDTGSGSTYDLRHFTMGSGTPPRLARWDYHATHINQMLALSTIADSEDHVLATTAARWTKYMLGKRADHN